MNNKALKMYVFYCSNGLEETRLAGLLGKQEGISIKTTALPCSGKVDIQYLLKAFETGADGVAVVSCRQDDCLHLEGSLRAQKRAEAVQALLEEIGTDKGRMAVIELKKDIAQTLAEIEDFIDCVRKLPQIQVGTA